MFQYKALIDSFGLHFFFEIFFKKVCLFDFL